MINDAALLARDVHAASEFNDNYRAILDEARDQGIARVRDKDGVSIVVLPEARLATYARRSFLADMALALVNVAPRLEAEPAALGESSWPWLRWLDVDDRRSFFVEVRQDLIDAVASGDVESLVRDLRDWQITANELRDEKARGVLLGHSAAGDYIEAPRPEAEQALSAS